MPPRISVLMPTYNAEKFIVQAMESILNQTRSDFEFVIMDDGSTDGTVGFLEHYANSDDRIRLLLQPHKGVTRALNEGVAAARGVLVARMDADDISHPRRFALQVDFLEQHPEVVAVGCWLEIVDPEGAAISLQRWPVLHDEIDKLLLQGKAGLPHPAAMIRRQTLLEVGAYREDFQVAQDKDLWLRLAERGRLANVPRVLLKYREHPHSIGVRRYQEQWLCMRSAVEQAHVRRGLTPPRSLKTALPSPPSPVEVRRRWVRASIKSGNGSTAVKHARLLIRERPWSFKTWLTLARFIRRPGMVVGGSTRNSTAA